MNEDRDANDVGLWANIGLNNSYAELYNFLVGVEGYGKFWFTFSALVEDVLDALLDLNGNLLDDLVVDLLSLILLLPQFFVLLSLLEWGPGPSGIPPRATTQRGVPDPAASLQVLVGQFLGLFLLPLLLKLLLSKMICVIFSTRAW